MDADQLKKIWHIVNEEGEEAKADEINMMKLSSKYGKGIANGLIMAWLMVELKNNQSGARDWKDFLQERFTKITCCGNEGSVRSDDVASFCYAGLVMDISGCVILETLDRLMGADFTFTLYLALQKQSKKGWMYILNELKQNSVIA